MATCEPRSQRVGELNRRLEAGRNQRAHAAGAHVADGLGDGRDVRAADRARRYPARSVRADRGELPIAEVRGEYQRGLAVVAQPQRDRSAFVGIHDAAAPGRSRS